MTTYWKDRLFVTAQFILMILFIFPVNLGHFQVFRAVGLVLVFTGGFIGMGAIWQLRHSISPFPSPKPSADLIDGGLFRWVRHPIYTGILALVFGYALVSGSIWRGLIAGALLVLFQFKARYEEQLLLSKFGSYPNYMATTGRFLPKVGK